MTDKQIKHKGVILSDEEINKRLNEQYKRIKELETKLSYYEPVPVKRKNGEDAILFEGEEYREYKCGDDDD